MAAQSRSDRSRDRLVKPARYRYIGGYSTTFPKTFPRDDLAFDRMFFTLEHLENCSAS